MHRSAKMLLADALGIWQAGVDSVLPDRLIQEFIHVDPLCASSGQALWIGEQEFPLATIDRIAVVGAGKAGAGMVVALEQILGETILREKHVYGWVNVPADCLRETSAITLHAARPAGVNEPTYEGVTGTGRMLELVRQMGPRDLCLVLLSGGGSALMPAPLDGISLHDKVAITKRLAAAGATIGQLNAVRRELSQVKGGGLAAACLAGHMVTLVLSDVPGDQLETIASGPTVACTPNPIHAIDVLERLGLANSPDVQAILKVLEQQARVPPTRPEVTTALSHLILGNNATAVDAAGLEAERRGYRHAMISATQPEGPAEEVAASLVKLAQIMRAQVQKTASGPDCLISGGEPTVRLVAPHQRGKGGRNQQLVLAGLAELDDWHNLTLLSGGTDGEDGPTDAAGAWVNQTLFQHAQQKGLDPMDYLGRNDAYSFFQPLGGLLKTGPTHTNVCDLRVITVGG
jgi:hydroxypyruvate reductase